VEHQQAAAHSQRDTIATMSRSTSTLAQRQELRRLLAQYPTHPTLLSHEGPGDEYLVTRKIEMMIESASSKQSTTSKQKLQSEW
jgi:ferredoxin-NADP reductase